jgi:hypothetical protein
MGIERAFGSFGSLAPPTGERLTRPNADKPTGVFTGSPASLLLPACFQRGFKRMPSERCTLQALRKFLYAGESA